MITVTDPKKLAQVMLDNPDETVLLESAAEGEPCIVFRPGEKRAPFMLRDTSIRKTEQP